MKIKLAILDHDKNYIERLVTALNAKFEDKFELYSFTDLSLALPALESARVDLFLAEDIFEIAEKDIPQRCGFAYLVTGAGIDTLNGQRAICKFQRVDLIYKQLLSIYSEKAGAAMSGMHGDGALNVALFASPAGGTGTSSVAAALAKRLAAEGKRVLYLNLEPFGSADVFFAGEGAFDMSDIIFSVKSQKSNLQMKLESCAKQDASGVFFYSAAKTALDMRELTADDYEKLLGELRLSGLFSYVVIDTAFALDKKFFTLASAAYTVAFVSDGSAEANEKTSRACTALGILAECGEVNVLERAVLLYNKFSNKTGKALEGIPLQNVGGAPRFDHATTEQVLEKLSTCDMLAKLM